MRPDMSNTIVTQEDNSNCTPNAKIEETNPIPRNPLLSHRLPRTNPERLYVMLLRYEPDKGS